MDELDGAIKIAVRAHSGQLDKAGQPYILHPLAVMLMCKTQDERIVAVLHDVIEDTRVVLHDLIEYEEPILSAIDAISRRSGETHFEYIARCKKNPLAAVVKIHDLRHNMSEERMAVLDPGVAKGLMKRYTQSMAIMNGQPYDALKKCGCGKKTFKIYMVEGGEYDGIVVGCCPKCDIEFYVDELGKLVVIS